MVEFFVLFMLALSCFFAVVGIVVAMAEFRDFFEGGIMEVHLKSSGKQEVVFPAGYLNRAARRRMKKMDMHHVHRVSQEPCTKK